MKHLPSASIPVPFLRRQERSKSPSSDSFHSSLVKWEQKPGLLHLREANRHLKFQERADGFQQIAEFSQGETRKRKYCW